MLEFVSIREIMLPKQILHLLHLLLLFYDMNSPSLCFFASFHLPSFFCFDVVLELHHIAQKVPVTLMNIGTHCYLITNRSERAGKMRSKGSWLKVRARRSTCCTEQKWCALLDGWNCSNGDLNFYGNNLNSSFVFLIGKGREEQSGRSRSHSICWILNYREDLNGVCSYHWMCDFWHWGALTLQLFFVCKTKLSCYFSIIN